MKDYEIATKYGMNVMEVRDAIENYADFSYTKNLWGDITVPDTVNIDKFMQSLSEIKEEKDKAAKKEALAAEEEAKKIRQEKYSVSISQLKNKGFDGYYEYKVISLSDVGGLFNSNSGRVDTAAMTLTLNELGVDGWHLVTAYSNELGKNALSGGAGGALLGVNSTVDENILIFERFVKI